MCGQICFAEDTCLSTESQYCQGGRNFRHPQDVLSGSLGKQMQLQGNRDMTRPLRKGKNPAMAPELQDSKAWIETTFRRLMLGFEFKDPKQIELTTGKPVSPKDVKAMRADVEQNLDAEIYARALKRMGIQVLYHHAKNLQGVSCYDTKVGHRFSLMGKRDFFKELVTACRKVGIIVGAMYTVGMSKLQAAQHPDWQQMDATGKRPIRIILCPNNPESAYPVDSPSYNIL